jgi:hypothetical protein
VTLLLTIVKELAGEGERTAPASSSNDAQRKSFLNLSRMLLRAACDAGAAGGAAAMRTGFFAFAFAFAFAGAVEAATFLAVTFLAGALAFFAGAFFAGVSGMCVFLSVALLLMKTSSTKTS